LRKRRRSTALEVATSKPRRIGEGLVRVSVEGSDRGGVVEDEGRKKVMSGAQEDDGSERSASVSAPTAEPVVEVAPGKTAEVVATRAASPERSTTTPSAWRRRLVLAAGPLALAAAMIVYVGGQSGPNIPALPAYTLTAVGPRATHDPAQSSDPIGSTRLRLPRGVGREARFELLLRPATAPPGKIVAYAFTFGGSPPDPSPLDAKVEIAPEGSVKFSGSARAVEGSTEIRIVLGAPTAIGKFDDAATRAQSAKSDAHVLVLTVPIDRE
jgi:hypothetical protein